MKFEVSGVRSKFKSALCVFGVAAALAAVSSHAAMVTRAGDDLTFTYDDSSLFGAGTVVGNSLFFNPTDFKAETTGVADPLLVTETLNIDIRVKDGSDFVIGVAVAEKGDYILSGESSEVFASLWTSITSKTKVDGIFPEYQENLRKVFNQSKDI